MVKKGRKKLIANIIITVAILLLSVFYLTRSEVVTVETLKSIKFTECLAVFVFFAFSLFLYALVDFLVYRTYTRKMTLGRCFINTLAGNLGSNVTPYKSAHYPMMAYYKCAVGCGVSESVTGLIKCQIIYSVTSAFVYAALVIILAATGITTIFADVTVPLWAVALVGFVFHAAVLAAVLVLSFCAPLQRRAALLWGKLLVKLKKRESAQEYAAERAEWYGHYREQIKIIFGSFFKYLPACGVYVAFMLVFGSVQYCAYLVFTGEAFTFSALFTFYLLNLASAYITNIVPVPGGVGTAEVLFSFVYLYVIPEPVIGSVLILWRMGSYYMITVAEAIVVPLALGLARRKSLKTAERESSADETGKEILQDSEERTKTAVNIPECGDAARAENFSCAENSESTAETDGEE